MAVLVCKVTTRMPLSRIIEGVNSNEVAIARPKPDCVESIVCRSHSPDNYNSAPWHLYSLFQGMPACVLRECSCCVFSFVVRATTVMH